ncbi:MAG TPA: phosphatidylglycerophosphatase A [Bryobacteraceae bacterium]|jgi:phosphatidylglycerophosphatase A|nr:phosphatidylglycerophosphatase A [Bryobacteraceae bacterium]
MKKTKPAWWLATWFGCGYAPVAPGTAGSLAAVAIAFLFWQAGFGRALGGVWFLGLSLVFLYPAIVSAGIVAAESGRKDPQIVVIDELVGQWLTLAGARHFNWMTFVLAFALFRLFDVWKPPPIRRIERIPGGAGIVLDDMMAGVYGALVLFATGWFN